MITNPEIEIYCKTYTQVESAVLQELREYTKAHVHGAHMLSDVLVGRTLQILLKALQAKRALDLGTFTGYSALTMAEVLPEDGSVFTCDKSIDNLNIAREFFAKSKAGAKIKIFEGLVLDCLNSLTQMLDFAFIDADKTQILHYIDVLYPKMRQGGIIVIDNALGIKTGDVLTRNNENTKALHAMNQAILQDQRFVNLLLPIREGLHIMTKL